MYDVTLRHIRVSIVALENGIIYSECVYVALWHAMFHILS